MLLRLLAICLLTLLFTSSGAAAPVAPVQADLALSQTSDTPPAEPAPGWLPADAATLAEAAAEPLVTASGQAAGVPSKAMEVPPARAPQRHGAPALAGIERPPRAASPRA
jgi:hypothetical protein